MQLPSIGMHLFHLLALLTVYGCNTFISYLNMYSTVCSQTLLLSCHLDFGVFLESENKKKLQNKRILFKNLLFQSEAKCLGIAH